jgi:hypothetical protein
MQSNKGEAKMKKMLLVVALTALATTAAFAGSTPGTGVAGSPHDMNTVTGLSDDNQGRVCAFCHTPHHAVDLAGQYNPLWSHKPTDLAGVTPYSSPTFDVEQIAGGLVDPLIGPSRLCMSCHDGAIAPDQHYGSANVAPTGRFASDDFAGYPSAVKNIAVGLGGNFGNDHPIGFDINQSLTDTGIFAGVASTETWLKGGVRGTKLISAGLYKASATATQQYMTCATCHDVHNKDNVENNAANGIADGNHTDTVNLNYFVYAPQSGSQLCLSCHNK